MLVESVIALCQPRLHKSCIKEKTTLNVQLITDGDRQAERQTCRWTQTNIKGLNCTQLQFGMCVFNILSIKTKQKNHDVLKVGYCIKIFFIILPFINLNLSNIFSFPVFLFVLYNTFAIWNIRSVARSMHSLDLWQLRTPLHRWPGWFRWRL